MTQYQVLIDDTQATARIEEGDGPDWRGEVDSLPDLPEGDVTVAIVGPNGHPTKRARARLVPGGSFQPTVLEGLEPFG